ncbi:MAG: hypothetical protein NW218_01145 [Saprospiraceae bacterium]|nr:hypothetical protein [Saprospiraceae bacterium]
MKYKIILYAACLLPLFATAQNAYDNIWLLGYPPNDSVGLSGGTRLDFSNGNPVMRYFPLPFGVGDDACTMSNGVGLLQFYTNGCQVANADNVEMKNGDNLNPGPLRKSWCENLSYNLHQGSVCLPRPGHKDQYVLFHLAWERATISPYSYYLNLFYATSIDMQLENGLGAVTEKNQLLQTDTNFIDNISAVRHGNGRDWWILLPKGLSDTMYLYLLSPSGIEGPRIERMGIKTAETMFSGSQVVFSPDGRKYIRAMNNGGISIFDFDRCTGKFICGENLVYPGRDDNFICGAAVSTSSRYLYISALAQLFQYDLWAEDVEASKVKIGEYDGFVDTFGTQPAFYQLRLAPDHRIYMSSPSGVRFLHVIDYPDSAGVACGFRQRGMKLFTHHGSCLPNVPHFRLFDVQGSPCDTLGIDAPEEYRTLYAPEKRVRFTPNPASGIVLCTLPPCAGATLRVYNAAGIFIEEHQVAGVQEYELDCTQWPSGLYIVSMIPKNGHKPKSGKLVVVHGKN